MSPIRLRLFVRGIVQGVGFRPFVYGLAQKYQLTGHVGNNSSGVFIEIEGAADGVAAFQAELRNHPPPLAVIDSVEIQDQSPRGDLAFIIVESERQAASSTPISPDICICDDCLRELFDPQDRRYHYPFINCTNCGPRFTIIKEVPYDRPLTTMADFPLCPDCAREYHDPTNRRFHAQPVACPNCGPHIWFELTPDTSETLRTSSTLNTLETAIQQLRSGHILAIKGLGGFHLACDATNDDALRRLRQRKGRSDKPLALMARDLDQIRQFAEVNDEEAALLKSKERPIVVLRAKDSPALFIAPSVAPGNRYIGVMLPYTPLHSLLLDGLDRPLVMTSANLSDEPICKDNDEARTRLAGLVDAFLMHNRDIHVWCDDSVIRVFESHEMPIRRSRGYAPFPIKLTRESPSVLATGGELKATFCLTKANYAYMSQHIGDMENLETLQAFEKAFDHFKTLFRAAPAAIACDRHPGYLSTRWAKDYAAAHQLPLIQVQHHHAHIAAISAEHGLDPQQPIIGLAFDGTGYGDDGAGAGAIWGGEVLIANHAEYQRFAHLRYVPLPGGDAAVKRPYRTALAHLWAAGLGWDDDLPCVRDAPAMEVRVLRTQLERNLNCVPTSSMGRLFDAIAALIGIRQTVSYEAQAAIEMEALCDGARVFEETRYHFDLIDGDPVQINPAPLFAAIIADLRNGISQTQMAYSAHVAIADLALHLALRAQSSTQLNIVGLSGGVFQNIMLLRLTAQRLRTRGFTVLTHRQVPPNDGGLALGQAAIALSRLAIRD